MRLTFRDATLDDVPTIAALHNAAAGALTARFGEGHWSSPVDDAIAVARKWPADAIRLDAYDAEAGAGQFYATCGFLKRGHVRYKNDPLVYYELLLD